MHTPWQVPPTHTPRHFTKQPHSPDGAIPLELRLAFDASRFTGAACLGKFITITPLVSGCDVADDNSVAGARPPAAYRRCPADFLTSSAHGVAAQVTQGLGGFRQQVAADMAHIARDIRRADGPHLSHGRSADVTRNGDRLIWQIYRSCPPDMRRRGRCGAD